MTGPSFESDAPRKRSTLDLFRTAIGRTLSEDSFSIDALSRLLEDSQGPPSAELESTFPDIGRSGLPLAQAAGPRYIIEKLLGRGGNGSVFSALDTNFQRKVAIKMLRERPVRGTPVDDRLIREARITAGLEHQGILPIYDLDATESGEIYFTTRQVNGISLGEALRRLEEGRPVPELGDYADRVAVMIKVADAVAFAHSRGVIHQDVKPDNVMLAPFGEVILLDWGTASTKDVVSSGGRLVGTPAYMSPEQARRERADEWSDVYGLGATLLHLLTHRLPVLSRDLAVFWQRKQNGDYDRPTKEECGRIPAPLLAVAARALAADPARRYASAALLAQDLRNYLAGLAVDAYRESLPEFVSRFSRTHAKPLAAAAAAALILVLLLIQRRADVLRAEHADRVAFEAERQKVAEMKRRLELEAERRDSWIPVLESDFSRGDPLDPRWEPVFCPSDLLERPSGRRVLPARTSVAVRDGFLELEGALGGVGGLGMLRWKDNLSQDVRIEAEVSADSPALGLALSGDSLEGYRVIGEFANGSVTLDTLAEGPLRILQSSGASGPPVTRRLLAAERSGNLVRAWIDGRESIRYLAALPPSGTEHARVGVSVFFNRVRIRRLSIFRRIDPALVPVLDIGRAFFRAGRVVEAEDFFRTQEGLRGGTPVAGEARFLRAISLQRLGREQEALHLLETFPAGAESFEADALTQAMLLRAGRREYVAAIELFRRIRGDRERHTAAGLLRDACVSATRKADPNGAPVRDLLRALSELSIDEVRFQDCRLDSLEGLEGATGLRTLVMRHSNVANLAPIAGLSVTHLDVSGNSVRDLTPLAALPLVKLIASANQIQDLSPLRGRPLQELDLAGNKVSDLAPLSSSPLRILRIADNRIADLTPLRGLPIEELDLERNPLTDLSPLAQAPLRVLRLRNVALSESSAELLATRPLRRIQADLDQKAVALLIERCPTLEIVNEFRAAYPDRAPP